MFNITIISFILSFIAYLPSAIGYIGGKYTGNQFAGTVQIWAGPRGACSAVKVSNHFLLTAAHCNNFHGFDPGSLIRIMDSTGQGSSKHSIQTKVVSFFSHPSFDKHKVMGITNEATPEDFSDLALVEIEDLSFFQGNNLISSKPIKSGDIIIVGGLGLKGKEFPSYGYLTMAFKEIQSVFPSFFTVGLLDQDSAAHSMGAPGDSGGPAFRFNVESQQFEIVGVNSQVNKSADELLRMLSVDPNSGAVVKVDAKISNALLFISKIGFEPETDSLEVVSWLRQHLPTSSFTNDL